MIGLRCDYCAKVQHPEQAEGWLVLGQLTRAPQGFASLFFGEPSRTNQALRHPAHLCTLECLISFAVAGGRSLRTQLENIAELGDGNP